MQETRFSSSLIVSVSQIVDGEAMCHCGEPAVLVVTSEPDGDPGPTCVGHAFEYIDFTLDFARRLWGFKATA